MRKPRLTFAPPELKSVFSAPGESRYEHGLRHPPGFFRRRRKTDMNTGAADPRARPLAALGGDMNTGAVTPRRAVSLSADAALASTTLPWYHVA